MTLPAEATLLPVPKTLSEKLRWARLRAGLSLDKLAAAAGTSRQYLIQLEKGRNTPSEAMLRRIAAGVGQEPEFFLGAPEDRLDREQRERIAAALHPLVDSLADELIQLVHDALGRQK